MSFSFPYKTKVENISFAESALILESLESLDNTIDEYFLEYQRTKREELFEDLCPYFGVPWPAGRALAKYALERKAEFEGESILEIGCGLALPSLVLGKYGISVLCTDIHPDVPEFFRRNCAHNALLNLTCELVDWRKLENQKTWKRILASDVLYDQRQPAELIAFLDRHLDSAGIFYMADPGRPYFDHFLRGTKEKKWLVEEALYEGAFILRILKEKP